MKIGTRSVLFGAHAIYLHWLFVACGWIRLYGWPWDVRIWCAFLLHDVGYIGKPNLDGEEGELHPYLGARIMHGLFDKHENDTTWFDFTLRHSRFLCRKLEVEPSRLCYADKLVCLYHPKWLYWLQATLTGELREYMANCARYDMERSSSYDAWWHRYKVDITKWVYENYGRNQASYTARD